MLKSISITLIITLFAFVFMPLSYASTESEAGGSYIVDRGVVGVLYSVLVGIGKTVEAVIFGRYGVAGVKDYFQLNNIFKDKKPQY